MKFDESFAEVLRNEMTCDIRAGTWTTMVAVIQNRCFDQSVLENRSLLGDVSWTTLVVVIFEIFILFRLLIMVMMQLMFKTMLLYRIYNHRRIMSYKTCNAM